MGSKGYRNLAKSGVKAAPARQRRPKLGDAPGVRRQSATEVRRGPRKPGPGKRRRRR